MENSITIEVPKAHKYGCPEIELAVSPYIIIFADEDGVIWARDMVEGVESERFGTVGLDPHAQDINVVMAVSQVLVKSRVGW